MKKKSLPRQWATEYDQKEVQFTVRILLGLNGAGVIALLTFLGQTWKNSPELRTIILCSIGIMIFGLVCTTLSSILHLRAMHWYLSEKYPKKGWRRIVFHHRVYIGLRSLSFILFLISTVNLIVRLYVIA